MDTKGCSRIMKDEWIFAIEQEEGEIFILELVQETIDKTQNILFERHIDVQILPHTIDFCKEQLLDNLNV
jgi:hypothetical protein